MATVSTTLGAVAGPNLVTPLGHLAENLGTPALAGPFLLGAAAYIAAGLALMVWLRPHPFLLVTAIAAHDRAQSPERSPAMPIRRPLHRTAGSSSASRSWC